MMVHAKPIRYYINRMRKGGSFAFAGYSDAEWYCILGLREGEKTGLGQILNMQHGKRLIDVLCRRAEDMNFLFACPSCLINLPAFDGSVKRDGDGKDQTDEQPQENLVDTFLKNHFLANAITFYERDSVTDDLARDGGLFPFIKYLRSVSTVIIGNRHLKRLNVFGHKGFIEILSPNLHLESSGIEQAVQQALTYGEPAVYLVSAGVSAAIIIDQLYDLLPDSQFFDCGSIWDGFVRIGGQREWRAELYADERKWDDWVRRNICG